MPLSTRRHSASGEVQSAKNKLGMSSIHVLVLNAGSSSLKFGLFNVVSRTETTQVANGIVERIGQEWGSVRYQ
eukprot:scaffold376151_cov36-Prasinocladus_malaysianus.AAC.1